MKEPILKVENLKVQFYTDHGVVRAVDDVSWKIGSGDTLGIVGESGCGKSVSILSILRLIPEPPGKIVGGKIVFDDKDILTLKESEVRNIRGNEISIVFQDSISSLNPSYTIGNQILETLRLHQGMKGKVGHEKVIDLLKAVGIASPTQRMREYPHQLSGGMNQRVMIAIALACNPKVLIADEPTTALDVTIQAQIMNLFQDIREKSNMSIVMITHDLGLVAELVDRVIVMYAGKIVEEGSIKKIFKNPHHPYTIGLLKAIPKVKKSREKLEEIPGVVPNLIDPVKGCIFYPRCQSRLNKCPENEPSLIEVGSSHTSRCWLN